MLKTMIELWLLFRLVDVETSIVNINYWKTSASVNTTLLLAGNGKSTLFRHSLRHQLKIALGTGSTILTG